MFHVFNFFIIVKWFWLIRGFIYKFNVGFCAEFNTNGALVQEHFDANCKQHNPPCPPYYHSAKAYRCKLNSYVFFLIKKTNIRYILKIFLPRKNSRFNYCCPGLTRFSRYKVEDTCIRNNSNILVNRLETS